MCFFFFSIVIFWSWFFFNLSTESYLYSRVFWNSEVADFLNDLNNEKDKWSEHTVGKQEVHSLLRDVPLSRGMLVTSSFSIFTMTSPD